MKKTTADRILDAQERFFEAPEYQSLWEELQLRSREMTAVMEELTPRQKAAVENYMGLVIEMQMRLLSFAVEGG